MTDTATEKHFGTLLKESRERKSISAAEVADAIKISKSCLDALERAAWDELPPEIFVRGFVKSYARVVGVSEHEPINLLDQELAVRRRSEDETLAVPAGASSDLFPIDGMPPETDVARRPVGLALFVVVLLVISIVALSYLLQQPPPPGEGLSLAPARTLNLAPPAGEPVAVPPSDAC